MIDLTQEGVPHEEVLRALQFPNGRRNTRLELWALRGGAFFRKLQCRSHRMEFQYLSPVKYKGIFLVQEDPEINWRSDFLQLHMAVRVRGKMLDYPFPPLKAVKVSGVGELAVQAEDETTILFNSLLAERLIITKGTPYTQFVTRKMYQSGLKNVQMEASEKVFPNDRAEWPPETRLLTLLNGLLGEIGFRSLEACPDGVIRSGVYRDPDLKFSEIGYRAGPDSVILDGCRSREIDVYNKPNRFVGYIPARGEQAPVFCEFRNENPASPVAPSGNGGYQIAAVKAFETARDKADLMDRVRLWAAGLDRQYETVTLTTAVMPHHGVREVVTLDCEGFSGVYTEIGWRIQGNRMEHRLRRIYNE